MPSLTHDCFIDQSEAQLRCGCSVPVLGNACVEYQQNLPTPMGYIGDEAVRVMRDTACNGVVVNKNKIKLDEFTGEFKYLMMLYRTMLKVPVARCTIRTPWLSGEVTAMCLDSPVYDLIVGNYSSDVSNQGVELPCSESIPKPNEHVQTTDSCENETYRSTYDDIISDQLESNNEVSPASVDKMVSGTTQISVGCTVETRGAEKRNKDTFKPLPVPEQIDVNTSARDFKAAQKSDPSLLKLFELATRDKENVSDRSLISWYEVHDGLLFRYFQSSKTENVTRQLVVPRKQREKVLLIGHETLLSGDQGVKKALDRIMLNFFWPGIYSDVKRFCASCDICQCTFHKGSVIRAPLQKPPIISTPFEKVAIDIVGPLSPATDRGNRYILTLVDVSTRYPEAIEVTVTSSL